MSIYNFVRRTFNLGVGTRDLGLLRSQTIPLDSVTGTGFPVQRQLHTSAPAFVKLAQQVVPVTLLGDSGMALNAQFTLQQLVELQRRQGG